VATLRAPIIRPLVREMIVSPPGPRTTDFRTRPTTTPEPE